MIVYCATSNKGKLHEFQAAASPAVAVAVLPGLESIAPPEEHGSTFEENAVAKAVFYSGFTSHYVFTDDSGLEVDALGGEPGVYSARYAGPDATDEANNRLVLDRMRGAGDRRARFVCVIALARGGRLVRTFRGEVEGHLLEEERGTNGFGYDPIFYYPPFGCSFGEVPRERKQTVSHRGKALRALMDYLAAEA